MLPSPKRGAYSLVSSARGVEVGEGRGRGKRAPFTRTRGRSPAPSADLGWWQGALASRMGPCWPPGGLRTPGGKGA